MKFSVLPLSKFVERPRLSTSTPIASSLITKPSAKTDIVITERAHIAPAVAPPASRAPIETHSLTMDTYSWDFGDGTTAVTNSPSVSHNFKPSLNTTREYHQFHIKVTGTRKFYTTASPTSTPSSNPPSVIDLGSWVRTLSVHNTYVSCKNHGYVVLPVIIEGWATKSNKNFVGDAEIKNNESVPIRLVSRLIIPSLEDMDKMTVPTNIEAVEPPIFVPANSSVKIKISVLFSQVPPNSLGFSAVYSEQPVGFDKNAEYSHNTAVSSVNPIEGHKTRATAHFLIHPHYRSKIVQPASVTSATPAYPSHVNNMKPAQDAIPPNEVRSLVAVGNLCDPDNLPENVPEGIVCQITMPKQTQTVITNARFMNARKGDVVLCPCVGSGSLTDSLLMGLIPPQLHGHCGIMTRNYEQITHCTASQERLQKYMSGFHGEDGFDPEALKYIWPGVILLRRLTTR